MTQKITERDFETIVSRPYQKNCKGTPVRKGKAEDGHKNCGSCEGNYYVGGECNFGGRHKLEDDLKEINKNFGVFDVLANEQRSLSKSVNEVEFNTKKKRLIDNFKTLRENCQDGGKNFFYGGCMGIDQDRNAFQIHIQVKLKDLAKQVQKYIEKVEKANFQDLRDFQTLREKTENLGKEITKLSAEMKNEKDKSKRQQILLLIRKRQGEQANLQEQIKNSSGYALFSIETGNNLNDIVKRILDPNFRNRSFFLPEETKEKGKAITSNTKKGWISPERKENLKNLGLISVSLLGISVIYWWLKSKLEK